MSINGSAPRRGNAGKLGGEASGMAVNYSLPADKEIKQHIRKLGVRDKQKLQECLSLAETVKQEYPSWKAERIAKKLIELTALNSE